MGSDVASSFFKYLLRPLAMIGTVCYLLLAFCCVPVPMNYAMASVPFWVTLALWVREMERRAMIRPFWLTDPMETSEERRRRLLDEIEKDLKKTRQL